MVNHKEAKSALVWMGICLFFSYLLPYHFLPFSPFYNDWLAVFSVFIVFAYFLTDKKIIAKLPWIIAVPLGIAAVITIQAFSGMLTSNGDIVLPVAYFIGAAIAIILGATITALQGGSIMLCRSLASAHLFAGLVSVAIASLQFIAAEAALDPFVMLMPHAVGAAIRPVANIAQPNQLALLLCFALAAVWWLYQVGRVQNEIGIATVVVLLWGLALTQSRIGWIIMPGFVIFSLVCQKNTGIKRISVRVLSGLAFAYMALIFALPIIASSLAVVANSAVERVGGAHSERLVLLQQAWRISLSHPWFGAGWYEFGPQQIKIGSDFAPSGYSQHAHNIVMNFAAELGWPITIVIFVGLGYWFFTTCIRRPISREVGLGIFFFLAVFIHSLVEYPLWYAYVLIPLAFFVGMVHQEQIGSVELKLPRILIASLVGLMFVGIIAVAMDYRRLVSSMWMTGWMSRGMKSDTWDVSKPTYTIFPHFYDYFEAKKLAIRENMSSDEIGLMEKVAKRFGYVDELERMALIYALNNRPEDAIKILMTVSKLHQSYYLEIYKSWKKHANKNPTKFAYVLSHMPQPILPK